MTAQRRGFLLAGLLTAVMKQPIWPAPAAYELLLASDSAVPPERVAGLLERNLPQLVIIPLSPAERYRQYAHFPVGACTGTEYFLLAHGKRLIAIGCLDDSSAATEVQKIRRALQADRATLRELSTEALYDGALYSAAAGQWPEARRYAGAASSRKPADARFVKRLQRLLLQQR
ncbi:MAG: hypothetical protein OHK0011_07080 [Turneriella sp.]